MTDLSKPVSCPRMSTSQLVEYSVRMKVRTREGWRFQEVQRMFVRDIPETLREIYMAGYQVPRLDGRKIRKGAFLRRVAAV